MKNRTRSSKLEFCSLPCLLRAVSRQETTATKKIRNETTLHTPTHHTICVGDGSQRTSERQCVSVVGCAGGGAEGAVGRRSSIVRERVTVKPLSLVLTSVSISETPFPDTSDQCECLRHRYVHQ